MASGRRRVLMVAQSRYYCSGAPPESGVALLPIESECYQMSRAADAARRFEAVAGRPPTLRRLLRIVDKAQRAMRSRRGEEQSLSSVDRSRFITPMA